MNDARAMQADVVHVVGEASPRLQEFLFQWLPYLATAAPHLRLGLICDEPSRFSRRFRRLKIDIRGRPAIRPLSRWQARRWVHSLLGGREGVIFHAHTAGAAAEAIEWSRFCGGRALVSLYEQTSSAAQAFSLRRRVRPPGGGVLTAATPDLAQALGNDGPARAGPGAVEGPESVPIVPGAINPQEYRGAIDLAWATRSFGFDPRLPRVGMVDDLLTEQSGGSVFVEAAARVVKQIPFVEFAVMGDGPHRYLMERAVHRLGLSGQFRFLPLRPDRYQFYCCLNLLAAPSWSRGFPWSLVEGIASRIVVLAADTPAHRWVAGETESISLFEAGDAESLAALIVDYLRNPARLGEDWGSGVDPSEMEVGADMAALEEYFASFEQAFVVEEDVLSVVEEPRTPRARLRKQVLERFSLDRVTQQFLTLYGSMEN